MLDKLLIATRNPGKIRELQAIFGHLPVRLLTLTEAGFAEDTPETGDTYAANALLKATAACRGTGLPTLADDSGLEVDALRGRPGLLSARYAGPAATDADRRAKLLAELAQMPDSPRTARFRCAMACVHPGFPERIVEGVCEGRIAPAPVGAGGFGYDPVFFMPEFGCTMAELDEAIKNRVSHRARAAQKALAVITEWQQTP
ncbi:MAG: RdgB/HAM1 family non-canonical purine NTP pyrophosphatase [Chloroflexi bacterium]|nr:RdgB/HAM1 family non-canonical purine NTP pyrophosphatase [Chloroflexota bacterium]